MWAVHGNGSVQYRKSDDSVTLSALEMLLTIINPGSNCTNLPKMDCCPCDWHLQILSHGQFKKHSNHHHNHPTIYRGINYVIMLHKICLENSLNSVKDNTFQIG